MSTGIPTAGIRAEAVVRWEPVNLEEVGYDLWLLERLPDEEGGATS